MKPTNTTLLARHACTVSLIKPYLEWALSSLQKHLPVNKTFRNGGDFTCHEKVVPLIAGEVLRWKKRASLNTGGIYQSCAIWWSLRKTTETTSKPRSLALSLCSEARRTMAVLISFHKVESHVFGLWSTHTNSNVLPRWSSEKPFKECLGVSTTFPSVAWVQHWLLIRNLW